MSNHELTGSKISNYAWAVIIASIVLSVVLMIVALHSYRSKRAARLKRQRAAENDKMFDGIVTQPLTDPMSPGNPPNRPQRGRSLVYTQ